MSLLSKCICNHSLALTKSAHCIFTELNLYMVLFKWQAWIQAPVRGSIYLCYSSVLKQETETHPAALSVTILSDVFGSGIIGRQRFSAPAIHYHCLLTMAHCSIQTNMLEEADASIFVGVQIQLGAKLALRFIRTACQMIRTPPAHDTIPFLLLSKIDSLTFTFNPRPDWPAVRKVRKEPQFELFSQLLYFQA